MIREPTVSNTDAGRPSSVATRSRSDSSKSISPFIARKVISDDAVGGPRLGRQQLDDLVLDQRRIDVEHHEEARHGEWAFLFSYW